MENASKALLIAAAVLIVIILVAFGMKVLTSPKDTIDQAQGVGESISDSTKSATSKLLALFGKTESGGILLGGDLEHNSGKIIKDAIYKTAGGAVYDQIGQEMPDTPQINDTYEYGMYKYTYKSGGWSVGAVSNKTLTSYEDVLAKINGESVTEMWRTFEGCTALTEIPELPNGLKSMPATFAGCTALTTVSDSDIPDSVEDMTCTFMWCTALTTVPNKLHDGVIEISQTFMGCTSLIVAPDIPGSVELMLDTFMGCTSLTGAPDIPASVTVMFNTFDGCTSLEKGPEIPASVDELYYTFANCTKLKEIEINATPSYYEGCFSGTTQSIKITGNCEIKEELLAETAY